MQLRGYRPSDCAALAALFYQTVHSVNAKDYSPEQLAAWASGAVDLEAWDRSFRAHETLVAWAGDAVVGFGDMDRSGYLDRLYIHKDYQGQGIASAICDRLETAVRGRPIVTHASITARGFFERRGYTVIREQTVIRSKVALTNFLMKK